MLAGAQVEAPAAHGLCVSSTAVGVNSHRPAHQLLPCRFLVLWPQCLACLHVLARIQSQQPIVYCCSCGRKALLATLHSIRQAPRLQPSRVLKCPFQALVTRNKGYGAYALHVVSQTCELSCVLPLPNLIQPVQKRCMVADTQSEEFSSYCALLILRNARCVVKFMFLLVCDLQGSVRLAMPSLFRPCLHRSSFSYTVAPSKMRLNTVRKKADCGAYMYRDAYHTYQSPYGARQLMRMSIHSRSNCDSLPGALRATDPSLPWRSR